jgi:hypothetical protein
MPVLLLLEKNHHQNFSNKLTGYQVKQHLKAYMQKKVKTTFSVQHPLKIKKWCHQLKQEEPTQWRKKRKK